MARFTANHSSLYFDKLCRTQKGESVLSLIYATYQAKKNNSENVKEDIANRLVSAYTLFKGTAGTYDGGLKKFESQYTIGHELCIWKNSDLDLTDLAIKVAENKITIRDYFDIVFLNYIQPVNENIVHILYHLLKYMNENNKRSVTKDEMAEVYMKVGKTDERGEINGAYNMLIASSYFQADSSGKELCYNGKYAISELLERCNVTYVNKGYSEALADLGNEKAYIEYLLTDYRIKDKEKEELIDNKNYTEEELAAELEAMYQKYGTVGVHLFGVRRGSYTKKHGIKDTDLCKDAHISDNYKQEIGKGRRLAKFVSEKAEYEDLADDNDSDIVDENPQILIDYVKFIPGGYNAIYYGTPGCGKSYYVENKLLKDVGEDLKFRTTFYPDYTHTDFVGQIMPVVNKTIGKDGTEQEIVSYKFIPGPFTIALEKAYKTPGKMIYLVIEEINRGNAASILGDLFQLLDRVGADNNKGFQEGQSQYSIDKVELINYFLEDKNILLPNNRIFLPSNLTLLGTMNTNDQNVSTLDTAFKRRWRMIKLNNEFEEDHPYARKYVPGTDVSWKVFVEKINEEIVNDDTLGINSEDKQIGQFFMEETDLELVKNSGSDMKKRLFAYKMLEYLWSNVAKYERDTWFSDNPRTLDKLVDDFVNNGVSVFEGDMFNEEKTDDVSMYSDNGENE